MDVTLFWIIAGGTALIVTVALFAALFRGTASGRSGDPDLAVYKDQLRSVERDVARGVVAEEEAERLRLEIKRRILEADRAAPQGSLGQAPKSATIAAGALVLLALLGGSLLGYTYLGTPGYGDLPLERRLALAASARENRPGQADAESQAPQPENPEVSPEYAALMDRLRAAVAERPDDARGLELLAENEARLGNFADAWPVQRRVVELKGDAATADDYAALADLMILAAAGYVSPEAEDMLGEALQRDGRHPTARFYAGLLNAQTGRPDTAFEIWEPLMRESDPSAPWVAVIRNQLPEIAMRAGIDYTLPPLTRGPSVEDMAAAQDMSPEDRAAMIENMVEGLADRLANEGGGPQEWAQLIRALGVLGRTEQAIEVWTEAQNVFADPATRAPIDAAARAAGLLE